MKQLIAAAFALTAASSLHAQAAVTSPGIDLSTATPADGSWVYSAIPAGSEAAFRNAAAQPQLMIQCARPTRQVTISKPASGAAPFLFVWTSSLTRNLPASFNPATGRISATLSAFDPLMDALAFTRGRAGFSVTGQQPLVVPAWSEAARVIEDCRT